LLRLNVSQLITIGGDDTAYSAMKLEERAAGRLQIVHVPKTIDNDLDLPPHVDTFGFQTARHYGVEIVKNLMVDAKTTSRWYLVITMGRGAGHLAVGIGKAAGATLTLIPEEFLGRRIRLKAVVDTLVCAIIKRLSYGRLDGVAVVAEGLTLGIDPEELAGVEELERDTHGNVRIAEVNIGEILKAAVQKRLKQFELKATIAAKTNRHSASRRQCAGGLHRRRRSAAASEAEARRRGIAVRRWWCFGRRCPRRGRSRAGPGRRRAWWRGRATCRRGQKSTGSWSG